MNPRLSAFGWLVCAVGLCPPVVAQSFTRITIGPHVEDLTDTVACAWGDYDEDGDMDLFVANGLYADQNNCLYRNEGPAAGYGFVKVTEGPIVTDGGRSRGATWGDCDHDGDLDLFVANHGGSPNWLYLNNGDGTFARVSFGTAAELANTVGWVDFNRDGWLDMFVLDYGTANSMVVGRGDGSFMSVTGQCIQEGLGALGHSWGDFDNDGDPDLFVADEGGNNCIYLNNGDGTFTKPDPGTYIPGWPTASGGNAGGNWVDYDNDGDLDLFVDPWYSPNRRNSLYRNDGPEGSFDFTAITDDVIVNQPRHDSVSNWADFDNDGDVDCFMANFQEPQGWTNCLYSNNGDGTFSEVTTGDIVTDVGVSAACAWADYDHDGDMDLYVGNALGQANVLYRNDNANGNRWLKVRLVGKVSNASGIGAKIRVRATVNGTPLWQMRVVEGQSSAFGQSSLTAHFGLGTAAMVDVVKIEWPSGVTQVLEDVSVNSLLTIEEDPIPQVALSFSEGGGATTINLGELAGTGELTQQEEFPIYSPNVPIGPWSPPNNNAAIDFDVISEGQGGRAIDFNIALEPLNAFTIAGWLNARDLRTGAGGNRILFALDAAGGSGMELIQQSDGSLQLGVNQWADGSSARSSVGRITEDAAAASENWVFFAVTYDGTQSSENARFFFGTAAEAAQPDSGAVDYDRGLVQPSELLSVGNCSAIVAERDETGPEGSRVFRGLVDEIEVYGRMLSLEEIREAQRAPAQRALFEPLLNVGRDDAELVLQWEAGRSFQLQQCRDLRRGLWSNVRGAPEVDGFRHTFRRPIGSTSWFYFRLQGY